MNMFFSILVLVLVPAQLPEMQMLQNLVCMVVFSTQPWHATVRSFPHSVAKISEAQGFSGVIFRYSSLNYLWEHNTCLSFNLLGQNMHRAQLNSTQLHPGMTLIFLFFWTDHDAIKTLSLSDRSVHAFPATVLVTIPCLAIYKAEICFKNVRLSPSPSSNVLLVNLFVSYFHLCHFQ